MKPSSNTDESVTALLFQPGTKVGVFSKVEEKDQRRILHFLGYATYDGLYPAGDVEGTSPMLEEQALLHLMQTGAAPQPRLRFEDGTVVWGSEVHWLTVVESEKLRQRCDEVIEVVPAQFRTETDKVNLDFQEFTQAVKSINIHPYFFSNEVN